MEHLNDKPVSFSEKWDEQKAQLKLRFAALTDDDLNYKEGKAAEMLFNQQHKVSG